MPPPCWCQLSDCIEVRKLLAAGHATPAQWCVSIDRSHCKFSAEFDVHLLKVSDGRELIGEAICQPRSTPPEGGAPCPNDGSAHWQPCPSPLPWSPPP